MKIADRREVRRVTAVLAGSRTGSSFLFRALNAQARFLAPTGEETPLYRRAGLRLLTDSDAIDQAPPEDLLDRCGRELMADVGLHGEGLADFRARLELQWPGVVPAFEKPMGEYMDWVRHLQRRGYAVDPARFETRGARPTELPPLEEPPFITPVAKRPVTPEMATELPLLLKTSTNIYRLPFLRALFPNAEFKFILLRRNPAATINALMDGWLSSAFHSHDVGALSIRGYEEKFWKFDLPPGWQKFRAAPLEEVCAFQWRSADERVRALEGLPVRYEDLRAPGTVDRLIEFAGAERRPSPNFDAAAPVAAVHAPAPGKWKGRARTIVPLLEGFGFSRAEIESWP